MVTGSAQPDAASGQARCWHWWESGTRTCIDDIKVAVLHLSNGQTLTKSETAARVAEFKYLVKAAQRGALRSGDWDRVSRWPDLWELRWAWEDGTPIRGYFHEPAHPWLGETVLARVHVKRVGGAGGLWSRRKRNQAQNAEMDIARARIVDGSASSWGLPGSCPVVNARHA